MKKKLKKGYDDWLEENPLDENEFKFPSMDLLVKLIQKRLEHPDCNAGAIFEGFSNKKLW